MHQETSLQSSVPKKCWSNSLLGKVCKETGALILWDSTWVKQSCSKHAHYNHIFLSLFFFFRLYLFNAWIDKRNRIDKTRDSKILTSGCSTRLLILKMNHFLTIFNQEIKIFYLFLFHTHSDTQLEISQCDCTHAEPPHLQTLWC